MSECLPDLPRYIGQREDDSWHGADDRDGPWRPIPAPQSGLPWRTDGPPAQSRGLAPVDPEAGITPADRMAFALCSAEAVGRWPCESPCGSCRIGATDVAREIARQLRERHGGSSQDADWLDGVGCHKETSLSAS